MNVQNLLNDEIRREMEALRKIEVGSDEHRVAVDGITKLVDRSLEIEKIDIECDEKAKNREIDTELKVKQMNEDRKDRWGRHFTSVLGIVASAGLAVWGTKKSFEFEKEGTITTIMGRGFINKLLPKK